MYLASRLEGSARAWFQGLGEPVMDMAYGQLKELLLHHFKGERSNHARRLLALSCEQRKVAKFNDDFAAQAAAATAHMGEEWVKETYISALRPAVIGRMLRLMQTQEEPLQRLMAAALNLEGSYAGAATEPGQPRY